jgi:hypothetical protein
MNLLSEFIPVVPGILCRVTRRTVCFLDHPSTSGHLVGADTVIDHTVSSGGGYFVPGVRFP